MKNLGSLLLTVLGLVLFTITCSNEDNLNGYDAVPKSTLIKNQAKTLAQKHNEGLDFIYSKLLNYTKTKSLSESEIDYNELALELAEEYAEIEYSEAEAEVTAELGTYLESSEYSVAEFEKYTKSDMNSQMGDREKYYIDKIYSNDEALFDGRMNEQLMDEIVSDNSLTKKQKEGLCAFISTMQSSSEYWDANYDNWMILLTGEKQTKFSFKQKQVIFSDCWWGWYGTIASGGNFAIGGCAGIAASCLTVLNQKGSVEIATNLTDDVREEYSIAEIDDWIVPPSTKLKEALEASEIEPE